MMKKLGAIIFLVLVFNSAKSFLITYSYAEDTINKTGTVTLDLSSPKTISDIDLTVLEAKAQSGSIDLNAKNKAVAQSQPAKSTSSAVSIAAKSGFFSKAQPSFSASSDKTSWKSSATTLSQPVAVNLKATYSPELSRLETLRKARKKSTQPSKVKSKASFSFFGTSGVEQSRVVASPDYLVFYTVSGNNNPLTQSFDITNGGGGTLNYSISESGSWLSLNPSSGSVTTNKAKITLTVNPAGCNSASSPYIEDIIINNNDVATDVKKIRVRLTILAQDAYVQSYEYDPSGNIVRRITPDGDVIEYSYDAANRVSHIYYPDGKEVAYVYNALGNRIQMIDTTGTTTYAYDELQRLRSVQFPGINAIYYNYDASGRLTKIIYPDSSEVTYIYDSDGRLKEVNDSNGKTAYQYSNTTNNLTKKTLPNGVYTDYTYDAGKRVTKVENKKSDGSNISTYDYTYDENNNITKCIETIAQVAHTTNYAYDKLNRLTHADYYDGTSEDYTYDAAGNRLKKTIQGGVVTNYKYASDNRLIRAGNTIFFYDKSGNLTRKVTASKTENYDYDYNNRLTYYFDGSTTVEFTYDGDGNRVAKTVNGSRINYVNDINRPIVQVLMEADSGWRVKKKYVWGLELISQEEF